MWWSLVGAVCAVSAEYWMRTHLHLSYVAVWPAILLSVGVNYAVWQLLHTHTIVGGFIIFGSMTAALRLGASWAAGDTITPNQMLALGLMLLARAIAR